VTGAQEVLMPSHPGDTALRAYLSGAVDPKAKVTVERHCLACPQCIDRLIALTRSPSGSITATPALPPSSRSKASGAASVFAVAAASLVVALGLPLLKHAGTSLLLRITQCETTYSQVSIDRPQALVSIPDPRAGRAAPCPYRCVRPNRAVAAPGSEPIWEVAELTPDRLTVQTHDPLPLPPAAPTPDVILRLFDTLADPFWDSPQAESGI
jgi:hypothetical protein